MYTLVTTVTLFLKGMRGERKRLAFLFLCLVLLCAILVLVQLGQLHHWHGSLFGQHGFLVDDQTPWDGGD
jgi:hypothetical protein